MLDLESRAPDSIPTKGGVIFCFKFYNPNLHNIARSDRIRFNTKNPNEGRRSRCCWHCCSPSLFLAGLSHIVPARFARDEAVHLVLGVGVVHVQLHVVEQTFASRPAVRVVEDYLICWCEKIQWI